MKKQKKQTMWIIVGVVLVLLLFLTYFEKKEASGDIGSYTMTRSMDSGYIKAGSNFQVTYTVQGSTGINFGVLLEDDITGGCTPNKIASGWLNSPDAPKTTETFTIVSPSTAGTCTFNGIYQFSSDVVGSEKTLSSATKQVCVDECSNTNPVCTSATTLETCLTTSSNKYSGVCKEVEVTTCDSCDDGSCSSCNVVRNNVLNLINNFAQNPTSTNRLDTLTQISVWAQRC
jgi:hypothetical protein